MIYVFVEPDVPQTIKTKTGIVCSGSIDDVSHMVLEPIKRFGIIVIKGQEYLDAGWISGSVNDAGNAGLQCGGPASGGQQYGDINLHRSRSCPHAQILLPIVTVLLGLPDTVVRIPRFLDRS